MSPTITGEERDALYHRIVIRLNGIDDVYRAVDEEDWSSAQDLAVEFSDLLRLLWADLGWGEGAGRPLTLSAPPDVLKRAADSLRKLAHADRAHYESEGRSIRERVDEARHLEQICERLLSESRERQEEK